MIVPKINDTAAMGGLYIYDFGQWTAAGYTAEEIEILLESEQYRDGKIYRIHHTTPDGQMEISGISRERFQSESGMFFYRVGLDPAKQDFQSLAKAAQNSPPPCRAFIHSADLLSDGPARYVTALIYPAECEDDISQWLTTIDYQGGDLAEGGISHVTNYYTQKKTILAREQLWSKPAIPSRSPEQVLASVRQAVQR